MSKINIENIVKSKLENYELPYDNSWNKFEKKLKKSKVSHTKYYIVAAVVIVAGVLYFSFMNNENEENNPSKIEIAQQSTEVNNNTNIIIKEQINNTTNNINDKEVLAEDKSINNNKTVISNVDKNITNKTVITNIEDGGEQIESAENSLITNIVPNDNVNITANFKANSLSGCEPFTVYFTPEKTENAEYTWKFSDGTTSNEKMPKHTFKKSGEYSVELIIKSTETNKVLDLLKQNYIKVNPVPEALFTVSNEDNIYYFDCNDNYVNVKWEVNSKPISTEIDPEYEFKTIGKSEVTLIVENEFYCKASYTKTVNIEPVFQIANAFTPDDNGDNEMFGPVFESLDNYKYFLYIYDAYGKQIFKSNFANQAWNGKINNSNSIAADGTYIWKLVIKDNFGNKQTKKGQVALRK